VKANFSTPGPEGGELQPSIEQAAHQIVKDRTGPNRVIGITDDIDSNGYWTVDDYEALMGLAAYHYLAQQVGDRAEARWSNNQYDSLLTATNATLRTTIRRKHLDYLPCSIVESNDANRCRNPEDANWGAPLLFGRWAWDAALLGARVSGPAVNLVDATLDYGFGRLRGKLPSGTLGGFPGDYYSTAYDAGYGSGALAGTRYRDLGIRNYEFMVAHTQSGPYSWWESSSAPTGSAWIGSHPATGQGSSPHAWGIANANKVLLDSIVAQKADGELIVGRGIPDAWLAAGTTFSVTNFPTTGGRRIGVTISSTGTSVTVALAGRASGPVDLELPQLIRNVASTSAGTVDEATGTVRVGPGVDAVTVRLRRAAG